MRPAMSSARSVLSSILSSSPPFLSPINHVCTHENELNRFSRAPLPFKDISQLQVHSMQGSYSACLPPAFQTNGHPDSLDPP